MRAEITPLEKQKLDDLLLIQFQKRALPPLHTVLSFVPMEENNEIDTFHLTSYLRFGNPGIEIAYPRMDMDTLEMNAVVVTDDTNFIENEYQIFEPEWGEVVDPESIDLVLVPLLVCDRKGQRVGYGKGFYDRYLKQCRPDCIKAGLSYFEPVAGIEDASEFDVPLNHCITPQAIYVF